MRFLVMMMGGLLPLAAVAHDYQLGDLVIEHPWVRATPAGMDMTAAYLTVINHGKTDDALQSADFEGAGHVMVHTIRKDKGVATMEHMPDGAPVPAEGMLTLAPGGVHLMVMDLKAPLKVGDMVSGSLTFKNAGKVPVQFKVEALGSKPAEHQHH